MSRTLRQVKRIETRIYRSLKSWSRLEAIGVVFATLLFVVFPLVSIGTCRVQLGGWYEAAERPELMGQYAALAMGSTLLGTVVGLIATLVGLVRASSDTRRRIRPRLAELRTGPLWFTHLFLVTVIVFVVSARFDQLWDIGRMIAACLLLFGFGKFFRVICL